MAQRPWQVAITEENPCIMYVLQPESNIWEKVLIFSFVRGSRHGGLPDSRSGKYHVSTGSEDSTRPSSYALERVLGGGSGCIAPSHRIRWLNLQDLSPVILLAGRFLRTWGQLQLGPACWLFRQHVRQQLRSSVVTSANNWRQADDRDRYRQMQTATNARKRF